MIQVTQRDIDYAWLRHEDLLAAATRARFVAATNKPSPGDIPRKISRIGLYLRQRVLTVVRPAPAS
ncbi:MAG: hypothetical protein AB7V46_01120 [Thermomicrobiales bacterium]